MNALAKDLAGTQPPLLAGLAAAGDRLLAALPGASVPWLAGLRQAHLAAALASGLPGTREERWRYTPLRALERAQRLPLPPSPGIPLPPALAPLRMVFVDGHFDAAASSLAGLPPGVELLPVSRGPQLAIDADLGACNGEDPEQTRWRRLLPTAPLPGAADAFRNLNAALAGDGVLLRVPAGTRVEQPLEVLFASSDGAPAGLWNLRNRIELGAGARLVLIERHVDAAGSPHLGLVDSSIALAADARLQHLRVLQGAQAQRIAHTGVTCDAGAQYLPLVLELGGALSRHEWDVRLAAAGAGLSLRGLVLVGGREHVDTRLSVLHDSGDTRSDSTWRSVAGGRGRSGFHGGITIAEGGDGADAALQIRSLLLSADAAVDAQPVLVIHADEVKASHGAAIGQLDPQALFYLRARGLPEGEAQQLLLRAFCTGLLGPEAADGAGEAPAPALRQALEELLHDRLATLAGPQARGA